MITYLEIMIPLLAALVTAIWGYRKFLDEREFASYQENVKNLFSEDKEVQLGSRAIASKLHLAPTCHSEEQSDEESRHANADSRFFAPFTRSE